MEKRVAPKEKWKHRLLTGALVLPACGSFALGIYVSEKTGAMIWMFVLGMLGPLLLAAAGLQIEGALLRSFRCPRCKRPIRGHMLDDEQRVSYICQKCEVHWQTGVSMAHHRSRIDMI